MCAAEIWRARTRLTHGGGELGDQGESWTSEVQRNAGQKKTTVDGKPNGIQKGL